MCTMEEKLENDEERFGRKSSVQEGGKVKEGKQEQVSNKGEKEETNIKCCLRGK